MSAVAFLKRCLEAGMPLDMAITAAEQFEQSPPVLTANALRQRRHRAKQKEALEPVTSVTRNADVTSEAPSPPSPKPPTTSPVSPNPFTPLKGGVSPSLAEQIWALQPVLNGKRRSTRPDVQRATEAAVRRGGAEADIEAACRAYYRLPDSTKGGGEFAMGAARLLQADRWRDFLPSPEPPPAPADEATVARRLQHLRDTGEWKPHWGERPRAAA